ncbi:MAG: COX15/CtaA family protein [Planctomycetota bacterium]
MSPAVTYRIALLAAVITYLLLALGGVVTSRDAGMIFPDWPLSNGSVNPEGWLTNMDMFSEHGHRILGALAGLATIAMAIAIQRSDRRPWIKKLGWFAVVFVTAQGLLGGLRVTQVDTWKALAHGCTGQLFFCLVVCLAYLTSRDARRAPERGASARGVALLGLGCLIVTLYQIVLGAYVRHINGPVQTHLLGALVVSGSIVLLVTAVLLQHGRRKHLVRPALLVLALLFGQVALGIATADVLSPDNRTWDVTFAQIALPSMHQALGALLLASLGVLTLRAWHRRHDSREIRRAPKAKPELVEALV